MAAAGMLNLKLGSEHEFRVIRLSAGDRKIALSMKEAAPPPPPPTGGPHMGACRRRPTVIEG